MRLLESMRGMQKDSQLKQLNIKEERAPLQAVSSMGYTLQVK